jgi:hypothetical protein
MGPLGFELGIDMGLFVAPLASSLGLVIRLAFAFEVGLLFDNITLDAPLYLEPMPGFVGYPKGGA